MLAEKTSKVLIINHIDSDLIEKAVFILRTKEPLGQKEGKYLVKEAEQIIDRFVKTQEDRSIAKEKEGRGQSRFYAVKRALYVLCGFGAITAAAIVSTLLIDIISKNF